MAELRCEYVVQFFKTDLRWVGVVYDGNGQLTRLSFYNNRKSDAEDAVRHYLTPQHQVSQREGIVQSAIRRYASGHPVSFDEIELAECRTVFQQSVRRACRAVGYGQTATYGELAASAGSPNAARAVGLCMRNNPVPLIVPCHRIVGSGDRLIGFSAGTGVSLKQSLLEMEGVNRRFVK